MAIYRGDGGAGIANPTYETAVIADQTGNSGKYLTTNGTNTSWATVTGGSTNLDGLTDVVLTSPSNGQVLKYNGTNWINDTDATGSGSFTYPGAGIAVSTGSAWGTSLTDNSANWDTAYTDRFKWDGGSTNLVAATGRTSLGATTVGGNLFTLTNPSAITFPRFNADNTVSALDATTFRTAIGAGTSSTNGTVTSVSWTGGIVSVATGTTTPAFTIAGTSGGIPYFSSGTTWATSAALAANALVVGGGAGAAPATVTTGTNVVTALGVSLNNATGGLVTADGTVTLTNKTLTSPRIGTAVLDTNGNEVFAITATVSAVNDFTIVNAATTNAPQIQASGSDANISINLVPKGTGTLQASGVPIVTTTATQTLTNKRVTSRVSTTTSSATPTFNTDDVDMYGLTALTGNATFQAITGGNGISGTPTNGQKLWIYVVASGGTRTLTFDAAYFENSTVTPITSVTSGTRVDNGFVWNAATSKWRCVAAA